MTEHQDDDDAKTPDAKRLRKASAADARATERLDAAVKAQQDALSAQQRATSVAADASAGGSVEEMRKAVDSQQEALEAQQRAMATATDAYVAQQDAAKKEKEAVEDAEARTQEVARRNFLKVGGTVVLGAAIGIVAGASVASAVTLPFASSKISQLAADANEKINSANQTISSLQTQLSAANSQVSTLQHDIDANTGFLTLSYSEQAAVEAVGEALIPSDSAGPGFKEAGGIYFIDRQLATDYGKNADMYMEGPFFMPNTSGPITLDGITYSEGTMPVTIVSGMQYQYRMELREFWRYGLQAFETYCNSAYGSLFESLSPADQVKALTDLYNNVPTNFNGIIPQDFFNEVFTLVWSGFLMDPLYGGNQGMVGWIYTGFNGVNMGNFYGEGHTDQDLMVASTPTRLMPASLAQYQKGSP